MPTQEDLDQELKRLRDEIADCDQKLLLIFKRRMAVASQIGSVKRQSEKPIMDSGREDAVLQHNQIFGTSIGLPKKTVDEFTHFLFRKSKEIQHLELQASLGSKKEFSKKPSLIIGGCGQMGLWFGRYLQHIGSEVHVYDPSHPQKQTLAENFSFKLIENLSDFDYEFVFVTTPINIIGTVLKKLSETFQKNKPLIIECASLKEPFLADFQMLKSTHPNITSIHPMFGPSKEFNDYKNFIICEEKESETYKTLSRLFDHPSTQISSVNIGDHDKLMAYVLGLSHLSSLVFAQALSKSGFSFQDLKQKSSTTFQNQIESVIPVAHENQDLYYDIQENNPYTEEVIKKYQDELSFFLQTIIKKDRHAFKGLMEGSKAYLR